MSPSRGSRRDRAGAAPGDAAPRSRAPAHPGAGDLGGRPPHRAARHVRGPHAGPLAERAAAHRRARRRRAVLAVRGPHLPQRRAQRRGGPAPRHLEHGPVAFRRDATRLLRHPRPCRRHGHQRRVGVAVLPVPRGRLLRRRSSRAPTTPSSAWPACAPGTTGTPRCGPAPIPTASSRCSSPGWPTWRWPPRRSDATPRSGFKAVSFPEFPARLGLPVDLLGRMGPVLRGLRGDLHRRVPAHRRLGVGAASLARPALRALPDAVPRQRAAGRGGVAVVGRAAALPGPGGGHVRGRDRLGADAARPGRLRARALGVGLREQRLAVGAAPERGAAPQLLVLHDRRPVDHRAAPPASASTTSWSRATTRTPTPRGPTPSSCSTKTLGHLPETSCG